MTAGPKPIGAGSGLEARRPGVEAGLWRYRVRESGLPTKIDPVVSADLALDDPGPSPDVTAPLRVLVGEDHPVNRLVMETMLAELDAVVVSTENGLEASEAFERQAFDLVLMDMQMPVMDGLAAVRRIRERERDLGLAATPIIMVTANAMGEHKAAGLAAGANGFVTKPLDPRELIEAILDLRGAGPGA